jgi:hypothetical protein
MESLKKIIKIKIYGALGRITSLTFVNGRGFLRLGILHRVTLLSNAHVGPQAMCSFLLPDTNQDVDVSTDFCKTPSVKFRENLLSGPPFVTSVYTDIRTWQS